MLLTSLVMAVMAVWAAHSKNFVKRLSLSELITQQHVPDLPKGQKLEVPWGFSAQKRIWQEFGKNLG